MALGIKRFQTGIQLVGQNSTAPDTAGEMRYNSSTNVIQVYDGSLRALVTDTGTQTLTNKTISGSSNTISNVGDSSLSTSYLKADGSRALTANWAAGSFTITANSVQVGSAANTITGLATIVNSGTITLPTATDTLVGRATTDTLTNKTISGSSNTLSNIGDSSLSVSYLKADGSRALSADWAAGSFKITANSVELGSAANRISGLSTIVNGAGTLTLPSSTDTLVGRATTDTLTNKTLTTPNIDIVTFAEQGSVPSNPSAGNRKFYIGEDGIGYLLDSSGNVTELGSSGQGGINYIDNYDAESVTDGWATYADAAGTSPVDGIGGAPTTTLTRSTSSPLRGVASFLITKDAANRQGEGVSTDFTIDSADTGQTLSISFDLSASANFVVGDSSDITVWIYDITNTSLIQPSRSTINSASGKFQAVFTATTSTSYRLILHISTTNASAWTFKFDNVNVGPREVIFGAAMSDWQTYSLTIGAVTTAPTKGTIVRDEAKWRRIGDSMEIQYNYKQSGVGSGGSGAYIFPLPSGYTIDTTKLPLASSGSYDVQSICGIAISASNAGTSEPFQGQVVAVENTGVRLFVNNDSTNHNTVGSGFLNLANANQAYSFRALVPITGWTSNVTLSNSSTFNISSVLANGTRVTSTPTKLGEYRSQLRDANAVTFTDTNGSPGTTPSSANGILIYGGNAYTSADSNNEPSWYQIFVGKNKTVIPQFYSTTGRTGEVTVSFHMQSGADYGLRHNYDPTTGLFTICANRWSTGGTTHDCGIDLDTNTTVHDVYFDLVVAENAQAVGSTDSGTPVQTVNAMYSALATGTTQLPLDDTIPQNTEGDQYMTLDITPKNVGSKLKIEVVWNGANSASGQLSVALFQDSTANALAAVSQVNGAGDNMNNIKLTHYMTAATTATITFKVRAGLNGAGTTTFNGRAGARLFGGVMASSITITEMLP